MKILIFNYEFPPVGGGGGHASYQIGRQLADRGHQILEDALGQQAQVMADACVTAGLEARVYCFNGHVACEVFYNSGWHMYDPDLEVFTPLSAAELHLHPDVIENLYANNHGDTPLEYFLDCCASPFDDLIWSGNAGGRQPRYFMHWYKWGIPLASMMLLTVYTLLRTKNCSG